jgi:flagellar hook protein FlgE
MSITSSFYTALAGLNAHGTAIGVIGDNISNLNTTGFKSSSANFEDILGGSLTGVSGANQTGAGANVASVDLSYSQGTFETTEVATDIGVNGKGLFVVNDPGTMESFYTRTGHFSFDKNGYMVNVRGFRLQGYLYDATGTSLVESLQDIQIDQSSMIPPAVTTAGAIKVNLDANAATIAGGFDITAPTTTANYSTLLSVYDTLGQNHVLQVYFSKTAANTWSWNAVIDGGDVQGGTAGTPVLYGSSVPYAAGPPVVSSTELIFDTSGQLVATGQQHAQPVDFYTGSITFRNGVAATAAAVDFTSTTQYGSPSIVQSLNQDGYAAGTTSGISIDTDGNVRKVARVALADFPNINGISRMGSTLFAETMKSGQPLFNKPGEGGMGPIISSTLEESNVDLASEIIKMIVIQRGYQANSKVISTTDEMLQALINLR